MPIAYTRPVSPALSACALTHLPRANLDPARAAAQHAAYERALQRAGCTLRRLPALPEAPDGVFVEDTAILLGCHAVITRPGAASRASEAPSTAAALRGHFSLHYLDAGQMDGGDVLRIGATLFVGQSTRTNAAAAAALGVVGRTLGFGVIKVGVQGCLHLKTAATWLGDAVLLNPDWIDTAPFAALPRVHVATGEPWAANTLRLGSTLFTAAGNPATAADLRQRGYGVQELEIDELQKAEAGLTCMSLISL